MDSNIQNNKGVIRCDCGTPIVKRLDSRKLEFLKYSQGQPVKFTTDYSGDKCEVQCQKCSCRITFLTNKRELSLTYVIAPRKLKSRKG